MKFFTHFKDNKSEVTQDEYVAMVHMLGFITQEGFYPGNFRSNGLEGLIEGYDTFTVSWWSDLHCRASVDKLPFDYRTVSESPTNLRAKFSTQIKAESSEAASAILKHFLPQAEIARVK